jgi:hypothetical protein
MLHSREPETQLRFAFTRIVARAPQTAELARLLQALERQRTLFQSDPNSATALLETGESPRDASLDAVSHAALTNVCLTLFNLDEAMCRE